MGLFFPFFPAAVPAATVPSPQSRRLLHSRHLHEERMCWYVVLGILIGFVAASFLFLLLCDDRPIQLLQQQHPTTDPHNLSWSRSVASGESMTVANDNRNWKAINVYVGNPTISTAASSSKKGHNQLVGASAIPNDYYATTQWFSQLQQDRLVSRLLRGKRNGYYVDLAANDAIRISNTYALEAYYNWTGLVIEPNPVYWSSLAYRNTNCIVVAAVIGNATGLELPFRFPHRAAAPKGGLVGTDFDNKKARGRNHDDDVSDNSNENQWRTTVSLADVLERFHAPHVIDYLSLDVEGAETFVMEAFPFDAYRINVMTVERPTDRLCALLVLHGYRKFKVLKQRWGETLWIHSDMEHVIDHAALDEIETEQYKYSEKTKNQQRYGGGTAGTQPSSQATE
jgi:Methyltransferase FkbM domain